MKTRSHRTSRPLRRGLSGMLAALALWALLSGGQAAGPAGLSDLPAALWSGLEKDRADGAGLTGWARLVAGQSPLLRTLAGRPAPSPAPEPTPVPDGQVGQAHDDLADPPVSTAAPGAVVARTLVPSSGAGYLRAGSVYLYNRSDLEVDLPALAAAPVELRLPAEGPQVLIMHTHGTEAYTPDGDDLYQSTGDNCRTLDDHYNVVRIGDEIQRVLTELGFSVLHDRTAYDYPQYSGAYGRSGKGVSGYLAEYPSIQVVLDVHRDALEDADGTVYKAVTDIDGVSCAQVELVLGSGEPDVHPSFPANTALACRIQESMNALYPTLARPMVLRSARYNQELTGGSLLVEIGCHGNTLQEALAGARLFARAAGQVLSGLRA